MSRGDETRVDSTRSLYERRRYPAEIIAHAVWLYYRFTLGLRDVEELTLARGIVVSHETIRTWCAKFGPEYARGLRRAPQARRHMVPGRDVCQDRWHPEIPVASGRSGRQRP